LLRHAQSCADLRKHSGQVLVKHQTLCAEVTSKDLVGWGFRYINVTRFESPASSDAVLQRRAATTEAAICAARVVELLRQQRWQAKPTLVLERRLRALLRPV